MIKRKKGKKTTPKVKLKDAYHKTMIKTTKQLNKGLITKEQYKDRFNEIFQKELATDITKIRTEIKRTFFEAIVLSALFGVLVSSFINSLFGGLNRVIPTEFYSIYIFITGGLLLLCLYILIKTIKNLKEGKTI